MTDGPRADLIGVVLAGGASSRMGAPKAAASLAGKPLIAYPVEALRGVCERAVVVVKAATELPPLDVERWDEPAAPQHPLAGIRYALERASVPILVCAADMPFADTVALRRIANGLGSGQAAAVALSEGSLQPLLAAYAPAALEVLRGAADDEPLRRVVERLEPALVEVAPDVAFNVNTPEDLAAAERRLRS